MKKKSHPASPKKRLQVAIIIGGIIIAAVIAVNYYLDQANITGQRFGDNLASIQAELKNATLGFDANLTEYEKGKISKEQMLNITDAHIAEMQDILTRYDSLNAPQPFAASLQLFKLSTQTQLESDKVLKEWVQTGDNSTRAKSDQLLQQSFQYEMSALQSFNNAKKGSSQ